MQIDGPTFFLPDDAGLARIDDFKGFGRKVEAIGRNAGNAGGWFEKRKLEFLRRAGQGESLLGLCAERRDVRVVLSLWLTSDEWRSHIPVSTSNLASLKSKVGSFIGTKTYTLIDIFLLFYEAIEDVASLSAEIIGALGEMSEASLLRATRKQKQYATLIFSEDGPRKVAAAIVEMQVRFSEGLEALGLAVSSTGQYVEACRRAYFVEVAKSLEPGANHQIFNELKRGEVKKSSYSRSLNLGQAVCAELIERCRELPKGMPDNWLSHVTTILCDPRLPSHSPKYQECWPGMARAHERLVKKWLAGVDLQLFLQIFEDCSKNSDLRRMYPARRAFLEGLLNHHDIQDAYLIVSRDAASFIRRKLTPEALAPHASMSSKEQSAIYLNINGLHLFEGTHNFAARLGRDLDPSHPCITRSKRSFNIQDVTTAVGAHFKDSYYEVRHYPELGWQSTLIDAFRQLGLTIKPEHVMTPADYRKYRRQYGV